MVEFSQGNYPLRLFWLALFYFLSCFGWFFYGSFLLSPYLIPLISHTKFHSFPTVEFTLEIHDIFENLKFNIHKFSHNLPLLNRVLYSDSVVR